MRTLPAPFPSELLLEISKNVSMIITSFPKTEKRRQQPPQQYSAATLFYHFISV